MRHWFTFGTLRTRLTVVMILLTTGILAVSHVTVYLFVRQALLYSQDDTLVSIARAELASALDGPNGTVHVHEDGSAHLTIAGAPGYERFALIRDRNGKVIARTSNLTLSQSRRILNEMDSASIARRPSGDFSKAYFHNTPYRVLTYPLEDMNGQPLRASVGISELPTEHALSTLFWVLSVSFLVGYGLSNIAARLIAARLTRPLEDIARAAETIHGENLADARINTVSTDKEIHTVTEVLNEMLLRLKETIHAQQRFVADASHELRSPLTALRTNVEITLRRPRTEEEYRHSLASALEETDRLTHLVRALLTLSRADAHHLQLRREPVDLCTLVRKSCHLFAPKAETEGKHIEFVVDTTAIICGDPDRLREVIDNLLDNALRYAPPSSVVTVAIDRDESNQTRIRVTDQGPGIPVADRERIFTRFYRGDAARAREDGGTGLGLAIVRSIVQAHGGNVWVDESHTNGARFIVRFPPHDTVPSR